MSIRTVSLLYKCAAIETLDDGTVTTCQVNARIQMKVDQHVFQIPQLRCINHPNLEMECECAISELSSIVIPGIQVPKDLISQ